MRCALTGAAAGIGRALALELVGAGYALCGVDRDGAGLAALGRRLAARGHIWHAHAADLASAEGRRSTLGFLESTGPFDLVVHNAGINAVGPFEVAEPETQEAVLAVNLAAPLELSAGLLSRGCLAPGASWVFVSSLSAYVSYPGAAAYAASKDGLAAFASSLRAAVAPAGQHVLTVFPGPTRTEHARRHAPPGAREARRMPPEELARRVLRAVRRRRRVLVPGFANKVMAAVGQLAPSVAEHFMRRAILDRLAPAHPDDGH